ncbi:unnamed protein product, partial [marine sediment metagenome]
VAPTAILFYPFARMQRVPTLGRFTFDRIRTGAHLIKSQALYH